MPALDPNQDGLLSFDLVKGRLLSFEPGAIALECLTGSLWLTAGQEDIVIEAGEGRVFAAKQRIVIEALANARVEVVVLAQAKAGASDGARRPTEWLLSGRGAFGKAQPSGLQSSSN
jgi:hypothetical protein